MSLIFQNIRGEEFYKNIPETVRHVIYKNKCFIADDIVDTLHPSLIVLSEIGCTDTFKSKLGTRVMSVWEWRSIYGFLKYQPTEIGVDFNLKQN